MGKSHRSCSSRVTHSYVLNSDCPPWLPHTSLLPPLTSHTLPKLPPTADRRPLFARLTLEKDNRCAVLCSAALVLAPPESLIASPLARRLGNSPSSPTSLSSPGLIIAKLHLLIHTTYQRQSSPLCHAPHLLHPLQMFGETPQWANALLNPPLDHRFPGLLLPACPCSNCQFDSNPFASRTSRLQR